MISCEKNNVVNHPWLGMVTIPPIKMVTLGMAYYSFTNITITLGRLSHHRWSFEGECPPERSSSGCAQRETWTVGVPSIPASGQNPKWQFEKGGNEVWNQGIFGKSNNKPIPKSTGENAVNCRPEFRGSDEGDASAASLENVITLSHFL